MQSVLYSIYHGLYYILSYQCAERHALTKLTKENRGNRRKELFLLNSRVVRVCLYLINAVFTLMLKCYTYKNKESKQKIHFHIGHCLKLFQHYVR